MHYYQFNIADYRKDTAHLKPIEHYIYRTLIDWYYLSEQPIVADIPSIIRKLGLDSECSTLVQQVFNDFFILRDGCYVQIRIEADLAEYHRKQDAACRGGKASAAARKASKDAARQRVLKPS